MTKQQAKDEQTVGKLLSPEAREACQRISAGEAYWSQRAAALLALDEGASAAEAGSRAGLSRGQVRFWLGRFRDDDLDIFPEAELSRTLETKMKVDEAAEKPKQKKKKKKKKKKGQKTRKAKKAKGTSGRSDKKSKKKGKK
jgi:hypothetical protein